MLPPSEDRETTMERSIIREPRIVTPGTGRVIQLPGLALEFKTASDAAVDVADGTVGTEFPGPMPHIHRVHHESFYVIEGRFDFLVGERAHRLEAGSFIEVPTGVVHDFRNPGPGPARLLAIVNPGGIRSYFEEVEEMLLAGTFTLESLEELRLRYDTDEVAIDWSV
jgi:mannose-6-phosphate isomerase-like protein (cupin superfamily)